MGASIGVPSSTHNFPTKRGLQQNVVALESQTSGTQAQCISAWQHIPLRDFSTKRASARVIPAFGVTFRPRAPPLLIFRRVNCGLRLVNRGLWLAGWGLWFASGSVPVRRMRQGPCLLIFQQVEPLFQGFNLCFGGEQSVSIGLEVVFGF